MENVSAVLLSCHRPKNIVRILQHLGTHDWIDEVIVFDNAPDNSLADSLRVFYPYGQWITYARSDSNIYTHGRFLAAVMAKNETIYTQDDDCLVFGLRQLWDRFQAKPDRIAHNLHDSHYIDGDHADNYYGQMHNALLGWGAMFHRGWIDVLDEYEAEYGRDAVLDRKADKIFAMLQRKHHQTLRGDIVHLPGATGPEALCRRDDHELLNQEAILRCLKLDAARQAREAQECIAS